MAYDCDDDCNNCGSDPCEESFDYCLGAEASLHVKGTPHCGMSYADLVCIVADLVNKHNQLAAIFDMTACGGNGMDRLNQVCATLRTHTAAIAELQEADTP